MTRRDWLVVLPERLWPTEAILRIEVRLDQPPSALRAVGPLCHGRRTVTSVYQGCAGNNLLRLIITDPCFWHPREPHLYRFQALRDGQVVAEQFAGLRHLSAGSGHLLLTGQTWQPRAACLLETVGTAVETVEALKREGIELAVGRPDDELIAAADRLGLGWLVPVDGSSVERWIARVGPAPSVLGWLALDAQAVTLLRALDPARPIAAIAPTHLPVDFTISDTSDAAPICVPNLDQLLRRLT